MTRAGRFSFLFFLILLAAGCAGPESPTPLLFSDDFEENLDRWEFTDPDAWRLEMLNGNPVLSLFQNSRYEPPVRSPLNIALIRDQEFENFLLEVRMESTSREYDHRDLCLFFGWQGPTRFYYAHLATVADPHANSIFLVDDEPRVSIAEERTDGTRWKDGRFHTVRVRRNVENGLILVYFDDDSEPIMRATDRTLGKGRIGVGSFDDPGRFDRVRIWAEP
ncbi:MAG TPA: hypothetical protein VMN76_00275 [Acidobacteriota bacterium]|nr:hypothetical protein [Acidobacteriota bacterium]